METHFVALEAFAHECLAADHYPDDSHVYTVFICPTCGSVPWELTVEHHTGSESGDFKGIIWGRCTQCGQTMRLFSFTGQHRAPERREAVRCVCGASALYAGMCERYEGAGGLPGFFDEGVIVARCADCGLQQAVAYTD